MQGSECRGKEFGFYFKCGGKWPNLIYVFQESIWLGYETLTTGVQVLSARRPVWKLQE